MKCKGCRILDQQAEGGLGCKVFRLQCVGVQEMQGMVRGCMM